MGNAFQHLSVQIQHEYGTAYMLAFKVSDNVLLLAYLSYAFHLILIVSLNCKCVPFALLPHD